jgi:predicted outer membrane repeat protein
MIPLAQPDLSGNEETNLRECIRTGWVSSVGPFVDRFERMVVDATGSAHATATSSGTTGLHAALLAVGTRPGDLVAIPAFTFIATANAVAHCGATPWLIDVARESWTLDPALLARELTQHAERRGADLVHRASGRRIAAIMPVHTLGLPADMDAIVAVAREHGLPVVADAAAALGATCRGRPVGALGATLSVISFNGNKTVTAGGGGAICGDDAELCKAVRHLTSTARIGEDYDHDRVGYNYRMTNLQAAVGCAQLERLDTLVARKREIDAGYRWALADLDVEFFPTPNWATSACWFSGVVTAKARALVGPLRARGIGARPFWKPMHLQMPYRDAPRSAMTVTDELWSSILTLPCSTNLSETEFDQVVSVLKACWRTA